MAEKLFQHTLRVPAPLGATTKYMTCWLPQDPRVKEGTLITLDGEPEIWEVIWQGETPMFAGEFNRKWGLALPKSQRTER